METASIIPPADAHAIAGDLACSTCEYNLKGLRSDANCPECGQPVTRTLRFGLIHSQAGWLRQQASAMLWLAALGLSNVGRSSFGYRQYPVSIYAGHALAIAATAVAFVGCWRLSVAEPDVNSADEGGTIRRGLRLTSLLLLILNVAALPFFHGATSSNFESPGGLFVYGRPILLAVTGFLALLLLSQLAKRSGSPSLRTHARVVLYTVPILSLRVLIFYWSILIDARAIEDYVLAFYQALDVLAAAAFIAMLMLLGRMYETLRSAAK